MRIVFPPERIMIRLLYTHTHSQAHKQAPKPARTHAHSTTTTTTTNAKAIKTRLFLESSCGPTRLTMSNSSFRFYRSSFRHLSSNWCPAISCLSTTMVHAHNRHNYSFYLNGCADVRTTKPKHESSLRKSAFIA